MRVAVYVRVSTSRQVKLQTIEQQLERVRKHVREKGWKLPEENVFRDDGYSGTTLKRPALDTLRDRVRIRDLEVVVVLSPDRLARNYVHQMVLIEEFEKGGCRVEFVERPMSYEPKTTNSSCRSAERWLSTRGRCSRRGCAEVGLPSTKPGCSCRGHTSPTATASTPTGPATRRE